MIDTFSNGEAETWGVKLFVWLAWDKAETIQFSLGEHHTTWTHQHESMPHFHNEILGDLHVHKEQAANSNS